MLANHFLTEQDTSAFGHKMTEALSKGWSLHRGPSDAFDSRPGVMRCGQTVVKGVDATYSPEIRLGQL